MRRVTFILFPVLVLAWWTQVNAQADDPPNPDLVVLTDEQGKYPLGLHLEILEDPSGELTIEDVASPAFDSRFTHSQVEVPNYGFTDSAYWVRLHLLNEARLANRWLLAVGFANMQFVDLYTPLPDGQGFTVKQTGNLRPVSTRDVLHPDIVFELSLPTQGQQTFYLRFQNGASMTLPLTLWSPDAFMIESQWSHAIHGLYFGVLVALLFYNLFVLLSLREVSYLYLVILLASMIVFDAAYTDYLEIYIIPSLYFLKKNYMALSFALIFISMILFADSFLEVKTRLPKLHRVYIAILVVWGLIIILTPFTSYLTLAGLMVPWAIPSLAAILTAGIISWRGGFRPARFFMFAWLGLVATFFLVIVVRLDVVPSTVFTENAFRLGWVWMAVCWSIALADRINLLKAETEGANRDLRSSKRRLSQILDGLPLGVVVYGKDNKPNFANRRSLEILENPSRGIEPGLSAGRTLVEAMKYYSFRLAGTDQDYPIEKMPVYRALQGEPASADDAEADLIDRRVPLEIWASPVVDDAGDVEEAVVAFQDITARKQVEKALRSSEKRFRAIVENNFDGIIFMDRDRTILYVSPSYEQLIGFTAQEMTGQSGAGFVHPDDRDRIANVFAEILRQPGHRFSDEYRLIHEDGTVVWIETNAMNLLDDSPVGAVVLNSRNITERKQTEAELAEYRQHLESLVNERTRELQDARTQIATLFDSSPLGIAMTNFDGSIIGVNQSLQRITGYSEDELLHINLEKLYADPEQQTHVLGHVSEFGNLQDYGTKLRRRDGSFYYASLNLSRLEMAGQEVLLTIIDDVSDQVEVRKALTTLHEISHDLSTVEDLPILLDHALSHLYKIIEFDRAALMLVEEGGESLTIHAYPSPTLPPDLTVNHVPINRYPFIQDILEKKETIQVPDMLAVESIRADLDNIETGWWAAALKGSRSWLSLPLLVGEHMIGLLNILHGEANLYDEEDVELARTFTNQLAVAINNIHLNEQARLVGAERERSRIARDLHDSVTQVLFSASLVSEVLPQIWRRDPEKAMQSLEELRRLTRGALAEMRTMLLELRPSSVIKTPLPELLSQLTEAITGRIGLSFRLYIEQIPPLPEEVHIGYYRIAQEALNNVVKHAQASQVTVSLSATPITPEPAGSASWVVESGMLQLNWARPITPDPVGRGIHEVELVIEDDGVGYSPGLKGQEHLGIGIMHERAAAIQATLSVESRLGGGTRVILIWRSVSENLS